jgi:hypothetical protein
VVPSINGQGARWKRQNNQVQLQYNERPIHTTGSEMLQGKMNQVNSKRIAHWMNHQVFLFVASHGASQLDRGKPGETGA